MLLFYGNCNAKKCRYDLTEIILNDKRFLALSFTQQIDIITLILINI